MQTYLVHRPNGDTDILNYNITQAVLDGANEPDFILDQKAVKGTNYQVVIASAHDSGAVMYKSKDSKLVLVVSFVPSLTNPTSWASFYASLCICDAIACDSFVKKQLDAFMVPPKLHINLDGCTPIGMTDFGSNLLSSKSMNTRPIKLFSIDNDKRYWIKFVEVIFKKLGHDFKVITTPVRDAIGIAFLPIGQALASHMLNCMQYISVANDPMTAHYFDSRMTHSVHVQLERMIDMNGGGSAKPINDTMTEYANQLLLLVDHVAAVNKDEELKSVRRFTSNANIYERIYHSLNKIQD